MANYPCRRCGKEHACATPHCGHSKLENHEEGRNGRTYCNWRQRGALLECDCTGYLESEDERICREGAEEEERWPADIMNALQKVLDAVQIHSFPLRSELQRLTTLGERLVSKHKIVVQSSK